MFRVRGQADCGRNARYVLSAIQVDLSLLRAYKHSWRRSAKCEMSGCQPSEVCARIVQRNENTMKKCLLIFAALLAVNVAPIHAEPGDKSKLSFLERASVGEILSQSGYKDMTCTSGNKTEDLKGYAIIATCAKGDDTYLVDMWVSLDWGRGHINSVTKRN